MNSDCYRAGKVYPHRVSWQRFRQRFHWSCASSRFSRLPLEEYSDQAPSQIAGIPGWVFQTMLEAVTALIEPVARVFAFCQ
jgi:hypothetical protein